MMESVERTIEREQRVIALDHAINWSMRGTESTERVIKNAESFYAFLSAKDAKQPICQCAQWWTYQAQGQAGGLFGYQGGQNINQPQSWYDFQAQYEKSKDAT